jgi:hypothetical protein
VTVIIVATTCVGRDPELAELGRRYAHTATGGTDVVAVLGEPGIGKSALLLRLANEHGGARWTDVPESRIGARVWVFGAQSYRPFGTAAQLTVVSELRHRTTRFSLPRGGWAE